MGSKGSCIRLWFKRAAVSLHNISAVHPGTIRPDAISFIDLHDPPLGVIITVKDWIALSLGTSTSISASRPPSNNSLRFLINPSVLSTDLTKIRVSKSVRKGHHGREERAHFVRLKKEHAARIVIVQNAGTCTFKHCILRNYSKISNAIRESEVYESWQRRADI